MKKAIYLNVGNVWKTKQIEETVKLNSRGFDVRVSELYGSVEFSDHANPIRTARPSFRLPTMVSSYAADLITLAHKAELTINWTLNPFCLGDYGKLVSLGQINSRIAESYLRFLEGLGVDRFIIAHPLLFEIAQSVTPDVKLSVSTILGFDWLSQITHWQQFKNLDRICLSIYHNRDFSLLQSWPKGNIRPELLVNEFCFLGTYPCHGVYRDSCYMGHSHNVRNVFDRYPLQRCIAIREKDPVSWLRAPFVTPADLKYYRDEAGVVNFKVSGRTHPFHILSPIIEKYVTGSTEGGLLELWPQLQTIWEGTKNREDYLKPVIPLQILHDRDFLAHWKKDAEFRCSLECGTSCTYCQKFYEKNVLKGETK